MAASIGNIVFETGSGTGTGNLTLTAKTAFRRFSSAFGTGSGNKFYYCVRHQTLNEYEVGIGYCSSASVLVRSTVIESSNANALVNFTAGDKDVICDIPASYQFNKNEINTALELLRLSNGLALTNDATQDLADVSNRFNNGYIVNLAATALNDFTGTNMISFGSGLNYLTQKVVFGAQVQSSIYPDAGAGSFQLGGPGQEWGSLYATQINAGGGNFLVEADGGVALYVPVGSMPGLDVNCQTGVAAPVIQVRSNGSQNYYVSDLGNTFGQQATFVSGVSTDAIGGYNNAYVTFSNDIYPNSDNALDLGSSSQKWAEVHAYQYNGGNFNGGTVVASDHLELSSASSYLRFSNSSHYMRWYMQNVGVGSDQDVYWPEDWSGSGTLTVSSGVVSISGGGGTPTIGAVLDAGNDVGGRNIINTGDIYPASDNTYNMGKYGNSWNNIYGHYYRDYGDYLVMDTAARSLYNTSGQQMVDFNYGYLWNVSDGMPTVQWMDRQLDVNASGSNRMALGWNNPNYLEVISGDNGNTPGSSTPVRHLDIYLPNQGQVYQIPLLQ